MSSIPRSLPTVVLLIIGESPEYPVIVAKLFTEKVTRKVNPEKPDVPLNKNDAFQKVQKRRVQEKR